MNCRLFDKFFSGSVRSQFLKILAISAVLLVINYVLSKLQVIKLNWQEVTSTFINPGELSEPHDANWWQWTLQFFFTLFSFILCSILLSSIITAWITNLNDNIHEGKRRYKLSNHVIVFGSGDQLNNILVSLSRMKKDVLVVSENRPDVLPKDIIFYRGKRDDLKMVESTFPDKASEIYIIGEDSEAGHDSRSLKCLELLKQCTKESEGDPIHCFITFDDEETTEVFQYLKGDDGKLSSRLYLVDAINEYEYRAEQLVLNTDFIPVLKKDSPKKAHFILIGTGKVTQAVAYTLAHACHYPKLNGAIRKTCISIIAPDAFSMRDQLILARPHLFAESTYESIRDNGAVEVHNPERDILDIEWRFIEGSMSSPIAANQLHKWIDDDCLDNRIIVCNIKSSDAIPAALHLPPFVYNSIPVAVYLEDSAELINNSNKTMMYGGNISIFGPASSILSDPLMKHRSECGQRVNFIYELAYPSKDGPYNTPMAAWYPRCEADKLSSIYCAIGLPLREKTFNMETDINEVYEAEHRRWMMSDYLMGFRYGPKRDKTLFTHNDLIPFEDLPKDEQKKDKILIDNRRYILTGEGTPSLS